MRVAYFHQRAIYEHTLRGLRLLRLQPLQALTEESGGYYPARKFRAERGVKLFDPFVFLTRGLHDTNGMRPLLFRAPARVDPHVPCQPCQHGRNPRHYVRHPLLYHPSRTPEAWR